MICDHFIHLLNDETINSFIRESCDIYIRRNKTSKVINKSYATISYHKYPVLSINLYQFTKLFQCDMSTFFYYTNSLTLFAKIVVCMRTNSFQLELTGWREYRTAKGSFRCAVLNRGLLSGMPFPGNWIVPKKIWEISRPEHLGTTFS